MLKTATKELFFINHLRTYGIMKLILCHIAIKYRYFEAIICLDGP